jgi:hypothetical protein
MRYFAVFAVTAMAIVSSLTMVNAVPILDRHTPRPGLIDIFDAKEVKQIIDEFKELGATINVETKQNTKYI